HMKALQMVGTPYTQADFDKAPEELKNKSELDAVIAYLQGLGLALKNKR
ncbi:cytochrome-c oxidase, cbb3-type subunit II, partial [Kingella negevensis]